MTNVEFLKAVINANISEELTSYAESALKKNEEKNAKRRTTPTKAQLANAELLDTIISELAVDTVVVAADIAKQYDITTQKASALLSSGVKSGVLVSFDVKIKGKGKVKGYSLPDPADAEPQALPNELAV